MNRQDHGWFALLAFALMFGQPAAALRADSVTITPSADTTLLQAAPDANLGGGTSFHAGTSGSYTTNRSLLKFDLSAVPLNSVITSATLTVQVTLVPNITPKDSVFRMHRLLADWGEGNKTGNQGSPASGGEATWNHRFRGGSAWSQPGGQPGADYAVSPSSSQLVSGLGSYSFAATLAMLADLQAWVRQPATNFGWILISDGESTPYTARRFGSRESATAAPQLTVEYIPPPRVDFTEVRDGYFTLGFTAEGEHSYVVEQRDALAFGDWNVLTNIPYASTNRSITVSTPVTNALHFFRIGRQ